MPRHLLIRLSSPLVAFGGDTVDAIGVTRDFPALSMITGLFANALGWDRSEGARHNELQQRLRVGSLRASGSELITDFQTVQLGASDKGWTTSGIPEERTGGADSYKSPHLRYRDYHAGLTVIVAVRLEPAAQSPTLDEIAHALDRPHRPLFIGRKPCLPTHRLYAGTVDTPDVLGALQAGMGTLKVAHAQWPAGEGSASGERALELCDERNWVSGFHGGIRPVVEAVIQVTEAFV